MYIEDNNVRTYAWIIVTAISIIISKININQGLIKITNSNDDCVNSQQYEHIIDKSKWPAVRFAASLSPNDSGLIK